jgi:hypothetical protein
MSFAKIVSSVLLVFVACWSVSLLYATCESVYILIFKKSHPVSEINGLCLYDWRLIAFTFGMFVGAAAITVSQYILIKAAEQSVGNHQRVVRIEGAKSRGPSNSE